MDEGRFVEEHCGERSMSAYRLSLDDGNSANTQKARPRWRRFVLNQLTAISLFLMVVLLLGIVLAPFVLVTVPSGHVGVLWKRFGGGTRARSAA